MKNMFRWLIALLFATALLVGCGGGSLFESSSGAININPWSIE